MMNCLAAFFLICIAFSFFSCTKNEPAPLYTLVEDSGISFTNTIRNTKDFNIFSYRNFYNGGGVGIGDINNDGLADVYFTANMGDNKLFLNKGGLKFDDITANAGVACADQWSTGVAMVDINADGWLDIYVSNAGYINGNPPVSRLYINNRDLTFTESAEAYGLSNEGAYATHAAFFDYDLDGDLDAFIINNSFIPVNTLNYANKRNLRAKDWPVADFLKGGGDHLLRNDDGKFVDVSEEAGIHGSLISFGLGVTVADVNRDGYLDVYVSNDFFERDYLYINQQNGRFKDEIETYMQHTSLASMGADMADINNDGFMDLLVTDMLPVDEQRLKTTSSFDNIDVYRLKEKSGFYHQFMQNTLQLNDGSGNFMDVAYYSGVAASDWSWGGLIFDADNDGFSDIYISNGIYQDVTDQDFIDFFASNIIQNMVMTGEKTVIDSIINKMPSRPIVNLAYKNNGNLKFVDAAKDWGLDVPSFSNGSAYGDLDNDGDLDLVVNNVNQPSFVFRNNSDKLTNGNHYIGFKLAGDSLNTKAIGSRVNVFCGNEVLTRELIPTRGFQSSVDYKIIIGLGNKKVDSVQVIWHNRSVTRIAGPAIDSVYEVSIRDTIHVNNLHEIFRQPMPMFSLANLSFEAHKEDDYIDFYYERNIPLLLSREGPKAAVADVNGDGLDDVYLGGAANHPGHLYIQTPGGFKLSEQPLFQSFASSEDVAVLFFDADNDGDKDLFVGSGGNNFPAGAGALIDRLYINDGKGNFSYQQERLPANGLNTSVAISGDFNQDGFNDLFIGTRSVPGAYGLLPESFIYINDGKGTFSQVNSFANTGYPGMVTAAAWVDINGDKKNELVITGEWMYPRVYSFGKNNVLHEIKTGLEDLHGLWQAIEVLDADNDGDMDLVLGNIGENFYLQPTADKPVKLWINDFAKNGKTEKILTRTVNGKDVPVFMKREITDQFPSLKKKNLKHSDYANNAVQDLWPADVIRSSRVLLFNYTPSIIALNDGKGNFTVEKLPPLIQFSCVNAIYKSDINKDGLTDLVTGGNKHGMLPQFGRLDANFGAVLINKGKGVFQPEPALKSGIHVRGVVKDIREIKTPGGSMLIFTRNNEAPVLYKIN